MSYNADSLKKKYHSSCSEQRKENLIQLRENIAHMTLTEFSRQTGIQKSNLSALENGDRDLSLFNIQVYKAFFSEKYNLDISTDYLLGYSKNKYADENYQMITRTTGLTDESIDCLKTLKFDDDKLKLLNLLIGNYELFSELLQNLDVMVFQKKTMELNIYDPSFASIYAYTRIVNILSKYGEVIDSENV